jgi:hypothetical protein
MIGHVFSDANLSQFAYGFDAALTTASQIHQLQYN